MAGPSREPRPRAPEVGDRWDAVVAEAARLFAVKGYDGTSLQDVADAVGLLKSSLYHYITTKEDLLYEVNARMLERRAPAVAEDEHIRTAPAPVRLRSFMERWMTLAGREGKQGLAAELEFKKLSPRRLRSIMRTRDRYGEFVKGILQQGIDEGYFEPALDLSVATNAVFSTMRGPLTWFRPSGALAYAEVIDWHVRLMVRGLGGDAAVAAAYGPSAPAAGSLSRRTGPARKAGRRAGGASPLHDS